MIYLNKTKNHMKKKTECSPFEFDINKNKEQ